MKLINFYGTPGKLIRRKGKYFGYLKSPSGVYYVTKWSNNKEEVVLQLKTRAAIWARDRGEDLFALLGGLSSFT